MRPRTAARPRTRGFTLTELMITVALVSVLALIGVSTFRSEMGASRSNEPAAVIQAIRAAQEAYRAENQRYLNVSSSNTAWYPKRDFTGAQYAWSPKDAGSYSDNASWKLLGAAVTQPVMFRYLVNAGSAGSSFPGLSLTEIPAPSDFSATREEPWYLIQARANADGDEHFSEALATSLSNEILFANTGE